MSVKADYSTHRNVFLPLCAEFFLAYLLSKYEVFQLSPTVTLFPNKNAVKSRKRLL